MNKLLHIFLLQNYCSWLGLPFVILCYYNTANLSKVRPNVGNNSNLYALCFGETLQGWVLSYLLFSGINMHANNRWIGKQLYENCALNLHKVLIGIVKLYLLLKYLLSFNFNGWITVLIIVHLEWNNYNTFRCTFRLIWNLFRLQSS